MIGKLFLTVLLLVANGTVSSTVTIRPWGIFKSELSPNKKKEHLQIMLDFPASEFIDCNRRLVELMSLRYGEENGPIFSSTLALVGVDKNVLALPLVDDLGVILLMHPSKGIAVLPADFTHKPGLYILTEWKNLKSIQQPVILITDDELAIGNLAELKLQGLITNQKTTALSNVSYDKKTTYSEAIAKAFVFALEEFFARYQAKLNLSRMQSSLDYHGLMEISALLNCHKKLSEHSGLQQLVEHPLDKIDPQWRPKSKKP